jgi:tRNA threonylcarbamoyl adenosine modification protein (Sua5/YciO/YrdC/YwlC family)
MVIAQVKDGEAPAQVVMDIVRRLESGQVLLLPTDTVYGLHALSRNAAAVDRIRKIKGLDDKRPFVNLYSSAVGLGKYVRLPEGDAKRRILDSWPGSITWVLPAADGLPRHIVGEDNTVGVRIPDNQLIRSVCAAMDDLVVSTSANRHGMPPASLRSDIDPAIVAEVDGVVYQVEPLPGQPSEVKRWTPAGPEILRSRERNTGSGHRTKILIVCTGNICRSPMAEAMLRQKLRLAGGENFVVRSAGTSATVDHPPQLRALQAMENRGIDIRSHRSRPIKHELMDWADLVFVMTTDHLAEMHELYEESTQKVFLLSAYPEMDLEGIYGVEDPYGSDLAVYERVADAIELELNRIVEFLLSRPDASNETKGN